MSRKTVIHDLHSPLSQWAFDNNFLHKDVEEGKGFYLSSWHIIEFLYRNRDLFTKPVDIFQPTNEETVIDYETTLIESSPERTEIMTEEKTMDNLDNKDPNINEDECSINMATIICNALDKSKFFLEFEEWVIKNKEHMRILVKSDSIAFCFDIKEGYGFIVIEKNIVSYILNILDASESFYELKDANSLLKCMFEICYKIYKKEKYDDKKIIDYFNNNLFNLEN